MSLRFDPSVTTSTSIQSTSSGTTTPSITGSTGSDVFNIQLSGNNIDKFESTNMLCFGGDLLSPTQYPYPGGVGGQDDSLTGGLGYDTIRGGGGNDVI